MQVHVDSQIGAAFLRLQKLREEVEKRIKYFEELLKQYDAIGDQNRMLTVKLAAENSNLSKFKCKLEGMNFLSGEDSQHVSKCIENIKKSIDSLNKQLRDGKAEQEDVYKKMIEVSHVLDENQFQLEELVHKMKKAAEEIRNQKDCKTTAIQGVLSDPKTSGKGLQEQSACIKLLYWLLFRFANPLHECALILLKLFDNTLHVCVRTH